MGLQLQKVANIGGGGGGLRKGGIWRRSLGVHENVPPPPPA